MTSRMITTEFTEEDVKIESHLRPQMLEDYIGQQKAKETLKQAVTDALASGMSGEEIRSSVETILSGGDPHD